jgi:hypothetical protein
MIIALAALGSVYAFDMPQLALSGGGGAFFAFEPSGGVKYDNYAGYSGLETKTNWFGGGIHGFFDATYGELSVGLMYGGFNSDTTLYAPILNKYSVKDNGTAMMASIELLGKFPFGITDKITLFPLLGVEILPFINAWNEDGDAVSDPGDLTAIYFRLGGGMDFYFTDNLFLRAEALYGVRLSNKYEEDAKDLYKKSYGGTAGEAIFAHGGKVKVAVGYKFMTF